jgi:hypothetical protein
MKTIMFYVVSLIMAIFLVFIVLKNREEPPGICLTVLKYYSFIENEEMMEVSIFLNQKNHPLRDEHSYLSVYLTNQSKSKAVELELVDVYFKQTEFYLNQVFYHDAIRLSLPFLGSDYHIADLYIEITLNNLDTYHFEIGRLSIIYPKINQSYLTWNSLSGQKLDNKILSRLNQIEIEYEKLEFEIETIEIGLLISVLFEVTDKKIKIMIPDEFYILNEIPIIITFINGDTQIISHFTYFRDFQTLNKNGMLIKTYATH